MPKGLNPYPELRVPINKGNGKLCNPFRTAITKALKRFENDKIAKDTALYHIGKIMVEQALDPTSAHYEFAVKEIGLRLDGKPKETVEVTDTTGAFIGLSGAYRTLIDITPKREAISGTSTVSDRPVLSAEVCAEPEGCGEGVDIPEVSGGPGGS